MFKYIALILAGLVVDQISKSLAVWFLSDMTSLAIIPNVFHLTYIKNNGIAFSFLSGHQGLILFVTTLCILLLLYVLFRLPKTRRWNMVNTGFSLIISGAIGNLIDRVSKSYVIDFLDFRLIGFPIFNFADCFVCVGAVIVLYALFRDKDLLDQAADILRRNPHPISSEVAAGAQPVRNRTPKTSAEVRSRQTQRANAQSTKKRRTAGRSRSARVRMRSDSQIQTRPPAQAASVKKKAPKAPADPSPGLSPYEKQTLSRLKRVTASRAEYRLEPNVKTELKHLEPHRPKMTFSPTPSDAFRKSNTRDLFNIKQLAAEENKRSVSDSEGTKDYVPRRKQKRPN